jgi:WD40 repeat protein/serine/threonine protein kinase
MTACPSRDDLMLFLSQQLAPAVEEGVLAHLDGCEACAQLLDELTSTSGARVSAAPVAAISPSLDSNFLQRLLDGPEPAAIAPTVGIRPGLLPPGNRSAPRQWGAYEIVGLLGRGGMSIVYKARQPSLKRWVALKVITAADDPAGRTRFRREAEAVASLQHAHIVQVHEVGEQDELPYMALEYVDGGTLAEFLAGNPQEASASAALVGTLARAMHHAHERGILHRDLKPANVLLSFSGRSESGADTAPLSDRPLNELVPRITDFGLAKLIADSAGPTRSGEAVGTPSYMAPEQARGEVRLGPATDVYALGTILYEMLTGRPPFKAALPLATLDLVVHQDPPAPSSLVPRIPRDLQTICLKCLHKEPARRYLTARDLADDLQRYLHHEPIRARPVSRIERARKWARRHPAVAALGTAVVAVTLLGMAGIAWQWLSAVAARDDARLQAYRANRSAEAAVIARDDARWQAYRANLSAAASDLDLFNVLACRRHLEAIPAEFRQSWEWKHFHSRLQGPLHEFRGHTGTVRGVRFSPDGARLLSFSIDGTVRLWDRATWELLATLHEHHGADVSFGAFTPDGRRIVSATADGGRVWDAQSGEPVLSLGDPPGLCWTRLSADGTRLVAATQAGVRVWDVASGRELATLPGGTQDMRLACSPDGSWIAGALHDTVRIWDTRTWAAVATLREPGTDTYWLAFSPDGARLALGGDYPEAGVHVFDLKTRALLFSGRRHTNRVLHLTFNADGTRLASASMDGSVCLWDVSHGQLLHQLPGHRGAAECVDFSPDSKRLLAAANDGALRLWDTDSGELVAALVGHTEAVWDARYSQDGKWIASASVDQSVLLWDALRLERTGGLRGHTSFVYDVAVRDDGKRIASAAWDGAVRLWDGTTGAPAGVLRAGDHYLQAVAFSPDGRRVAAGSMDRWLWVWDADSAALLLKRRLEGCTVDSLAFSPDGSRLAVAAGSKPDTLPADPAVRLLDPSTGAEIAILHGHNKDPLAVRYAPDGRRIASAGRDGMVCLWDAQTQTLLATLEGHIGEVRAVAWSADGTRLASGGEDRTVRLWDVTTGKQLRMLPHASTIYGVAFSPDGTRLATGCADNTIRLWDTAALVEVAELRGHKAYVHALVFSPDGTRIISGSGDHTVRIWDTQTRQQGGD